ncbi:MAG: beta-lactamase family protein [Candidatus Kaiserbacteria bacterium]|nr:MAG: beta-lactamase family protein [Candidatus Kaiserbacteria bacterium]
MPEGIADRVARAIESHVFPGCVIGVVRGGERSVTPFGTIRYDRAERVRENTIYDLASVTKSIPLASLASILVGEGKFSLSDGVKKYLPELHNDYDATVEDLLRYRVHGTRLSSLLFETSGELQAAIFERGFSAPPGEPRYSNLPAYLLGLIVERATATTLPALAQTYFFDPLEMRDTTFFPGESSRVAPTEVVGGEEIRGVVHDESARVFAKEKRAVGHAGLFSTAPDVLRFLAALLHGNDPQVVSAAESSLGWQVSDPHFMGRFVGPKTFGKTGFTGTSVVVDTKRSIGFVILSNRTYPKRPQGDSMIFEFRRDIADILLE